VFSGLGDIQEARLRDAVLLAYEEKGIFPKEPETWGLSPPLFDDVARVLQQMIEETAYRTAAQGVLDRIKPFVDLGIFAGATSVPFEEITQGGATVALRGLHTDEIRKTVGQFFLIKLWYYIQNLGETDKARFYLVLDEADRLAFPGSPIERIVREARKFGVGVIVASQRPGDFTETVPANAACSIVFQCPLDRDASFMAKQVKCRTEDIQGLKPVLDALVKFDYEEKCLRLEALPYYIRVIS
jgi:DNA phosphorothioation-dependent restriction protein DptH